jgi:heme/copper-type cytochrome/quinol oxidase subunit 2
MTAATFGGAFMFPVVALAQESSGATDVQKRPVAGYAMLMMILLLMIVILVFGWFLMRSLQLARKRLGHVQPEATDATDVWAMHKLPESDDDALDEDADDDD